MNWQPMESAPKDGTQFAAYGKHWDTWHDDEKFICWWDERDAEWVMVTDGLQRMAEPKGWYPIPEIPNAKS